MSARRARGALHGRAAFAGAVAACVVACAPQPSTSPAETGTSTNKDARARRDVAAEASAAAGGGARPSADTSIAPSGAPDASAPERPEAAAEDAPTVGFEEVLAALFADRSSKEPIVEACPVTLPGDARVRCLYDRRYKSDARAAGLAHELFVKWHIVAGVEVAHTMDGGYRGMIRIEPAVPVGADRRHLEWVAGAIRDFDAFFGELERHRVARSHAGAGGGAGRSVLFSPSSPAPRPFRFQPITLRFMRSIAARTPAAYAHDWEVAYNFVGTLNVSADAVRETMFHELFHLNDAAHGGWSPGALGGVFDAVAKRCGVSIPCLAPYSPNDTIVRGGTYYPFQPGNGVVEYAAELALRFYREQRAVLRKLPRAKAFKCGPPENARAWAAIRDEFFAGVDAVPACP